MRLWKLLINKYVGWRWRPRTIRRDPTVEPPYLKRWHIRGMPTMSDGSFPFEPTGEPRPGSARVDSSYSLYLHKGSQDDEDDPHSHPWTWGLSFIFWGGYIEERYNPRTAKSTFHVRVAPAFNLLRHGDFNRLALIGGRPFWSLFLTGKKVSDWDFIDRKTGAYLPSTSYLKRRKKENGKCPTRSYSK